MDAGDAVLEVDLLQYESGAQEARRSVVDGVLRSLRTGFVYLRHDISGGFLDDAYGMLKEFFHLDRESKDACRVDGSMGQSGYTGTLVETAASSDVPDWKEMLNWGPELPRAHPLRRRFPHRYADRRFPEDHIPGITAALVLLHDRLFDLQRRFLRILAVGLGCDESFFEEMIADGPTLTRAIRYPPMTDAPSGEHVWAGAHGDINLITALPRATSRGLQMEHEETWKDVAPPEGAAILNTGIMLERLTNGRIPTGIHRVVAAEGSERERFSVVQFCHPTPWTILTPVAGTVDAEHPQRFAPIQAGDLLDRVLYDINLVDEARRIDSGPAPQAGGAN